MHAYLPHTPEDLEHMLSVSKTSGMEGLFADVPRKLILSRELDIPEGASEAEVLGRLEALAARNRVDRVSFLGCGSYDHFSPAVVSSLVGRSEFVTAYTPYQAEMSQGMLQAIFEFQTMICDLTALDASNASLYDGATAACEAAAMALDSVRKSSVVLYSGTLHPSIKSVLHTHFSSLDVQLEEVAERDGVMDRADLKKRLRPGVAALLVQSPNILGYVEDLGGIAEELHAAGALLIISANPLSLGILKPPGEWGADIAVGDAQPLGLASSFGGPSAGYLAARESLLRRMPGRIVGQSVDREGKRAFLLTLQAREQHIKRERATSNICSNQALAALAVTVHLATLGPTGVRETAEQCLRKAHYLEERMLRELPVEPAARRPFWNEFTLKLKKSPAAVIAGMEQEGFYAGVDLSGLEGGKRPGLLGVAVTERRTREEMDRYVEAMRRVLA